MDWDLFVAILEVFSELVLSEKNPSAKGRSVMARCMWPVGWMGIRVLYSTSCACRDSIKEDRGFEIAQPCLLRIYARMFVPYPFVFPRKSEPTSCTLVNLCAPPFQSL